MLIIYVLFNSLFLIDIFRYYSIGNLEMANAWNGLFCVRVQTHFGKLPIYLKLEIT